MLTLQCGPVQAVRRNDEVVHAQNHFYRPNTSLLVLVMHVCVYECHKPWSHSQGMTTVLVSKFTLFPMEGIGLNKGHDPPFAQTQITTCMWMWMCVTRITNGDCTTFVPTWDINVLITCKIQLIQSWNWQYLTRVDMLWNTLEAHPSLSMPWASRVISNPLTKINWRKFHAFVVFGKSQMNVW